MLYYVVDGVVVVWGVALFGVLLCLYVCYGCDLCYFLLLLICCLGFGVAGGLFCAYSRVLGCV